MRLNVAIEIHAHEAVELQEAGIDVSHHAGGGKHFGDDVAAEPAKSAPLCQLVDFVGVDARIDGPPISTMECGTSGRCLLP